MTPLALLSCVSNPTITKSEPDPIPQSTATTNDPDTLPVPNIEFSDDALALQLIKLDAEEKWSALTTPQPVRPPLDLTRPSHYDKYPDDLYQVMRKGFRFDLTLEHPRIESQLKWYASHQSYINRVSERASRYMFYIVQELQANDVPLDIALLPIVESAFDPFAYSHGSAAGMWQFIPSTGRMFGLKQDWWYDGRRDVVESTRAAIEYLKQLNAMFDGDWELALAAYNSGPGTVMRAQRKNRAAGKPTDYWSLDLPRETEAYVPKIYALAKLFYSPDEYGIELPIVADEPFFAIVETGGQIDLAQAAAMADMELSQLYLLNPGYNRWATSPDEPHRLLVHADKAALFNTNIAQLPPNKRLAWHRHTIKPGESLLGIAAQYEVTTDVIKDVNNISGTLIRAGDHLMIPVASQGESVYSLSADNRLRTTQNALEGSNRQRLDYTVRSGDTFWELSQQYGVSVQSIARWNNMAPKDILRPGQTLVLWLPPNQSGTGSQTIASIDDRQIMRKVSYVVRQGDSLSRIASRFNVRISDIQEWNILGRYLQPGQQLTLFVDVTRVQ